MARSGVCGRCGGRRVLGWCIRCEIQSKDLLVHREILVLAVLMLVTVAAFFVTRSVAAVNQAQRSEDARIWFALGEQSLRRGDADAAVAAFRQAAVKDATVPRYRQALASALVAAHDEDAARQVLFDLRERQPEDAETNLQLARLEVRRGDRVAVERYYQTAVVGLWKADQRSEQHQVRTEFIEFLLEHGERDRALSELLALEAAVPADVPSQLAAGQMLLAAGDPRRASDHFARALRLEPANSAAMAGAGEALFESGDYQGARRVFSRFDPTTERARALRELTNLVLNSDGLAPRLPMSERRRRLAAGLTRVNQRLDACDARDASKRLDVRVDLAPLLVETRAIVATLGAGRGSNAFDDVEAGFDVIYRAEQAAEQACGSPDPFDRALVLVGRRHGLEEQ